jgi:UPF0755 protein
MKKIALYILVLVLAVAAWLGWQVFGPTVNAPEGQYLYIKTGADYNQVMSQLQEEKIIKGTRVFEFLADRVHYSEHVKAGRYYIKDGMSIYNLLHMLKGGRQTPVKLVINKLRTKEDLAQKIGLHFECDSLQVIQFLNSNDSLQSFQLDSHTVMTAVIPNTYLLNWNGSFKKLFTRLHSEHKKFWNETRLQKAADKNMRPSQVYSMASIVEEETNKKSDKGLIASVYINRIKQGMKLDADPTVKYAMRNFGLKRILFGHLQYPSVYNTYQQKGLPPGPICTPSIETIDAVLNAPETNYIFFVAKPDFNGYSNFAATYDEHLLYAKQYRDALDELIRNKAAAKQ